MKRGKTERGTLAAVQDVSSVMQQLPPFPDDAPGFEPGVPAPGEPAQPSQPGQPSETPTEAPPAEAPIDVPSPAGPGTDAPATPISPVG